MDSSWLQNLNHHTQVIVPTRSLANELTQQLTQYYLTKEQSVWAGCEISTWQDFLNQLFEYNRHALAAFYKQGKLSLITSQQATLVWRKVVDDTKREEKELALLNVQQSAKAAQRSWGLAKDWYVNLDQLDDHHLEDSRQFSKWCQQYKTLMHNKGLLDSQLLLEGLLELSKVEKLRLNYQTIELYAFDLLGDSQRGLIECLRTQGVQINDRQIPSNLASECYFTSYETSKDELNKVFAVAREVLEENPDARINIIVPQLQERIAEVREAAAEVFYPSSSPLTLQNNNLVYRFSLGEPMAEWAAIDSALSALALLKGRINLSQLSLLFRSQFMASCRAHSKVLMQFLSWLRYCRINEILLSGLPALFLRYCESQNKAIASSEIGEQQCQLTHQFLSQLLEFQEKLQTRLIDNKEANGYSALHFSEWEHTFKEWLSLWGWATSVSNSEFSTVQFQLAERWSKTLAEFSNMAMVQRQCGLSRAIELITLMARDAVFLPKAADSPVFISGLYESIGRAVDVCFLTSMDDRFPAPTKQDPFIGHELSKCKNYPSADNVTELAQSKRVVKSLLSSAKECRISYAKSDAEDVNVTRSVSALFRAESFTDALKSESPSLVKVELEMYQDLVGKPLADASLARGGSRIFEDQSNCAFKAFVSHRLGFSAEEEPEFGLDHIDRGNIIHAILDRVWGEIGGQENLIALRDSDSLGATVRSAIEDVISEIETSSNQTTLSDDKKTLLGFEIKRLEMTTGEWLEIEAQRPTSFSVIEREQAATGNVGGITFRYVIDRVDCLDDGRTVIIDYKTGQVDKNDWKGPRLRKPQLPLYYLANSKSKQNASSGFAYGKIKRYSSEFVELAEQGIFKRLPHHAMKTEMLWFESSEQWPAMFDSLAAQFLQGSAQVNPIDDQSCKYCDLQAMCRVSQLRSQSKPLSKDVQGTDSL